MMHSASLFPAPFTWYSPILQCTSCSLSAALSTTFFLKPSIRAVSSSLSLTFFRKRIYSSPPYLHAMSEDPHISCSAAAISRIQKSPVFHPFFLFVFERFHLAGRKNNISIYHQTPDCNKAYILIHNNLHIFNLLLRNSL